jgi:hypothetical protein
MCAFFAETGHQADEIAARQLHVLGRYQGAHERPIKLHDVKEMFLRMRDHLP